MTYIAQFSRRYPDLVDLLLFFEVYLTNFLFASIQPFGSINKEHGELLRWLADTRQRLTHVIEAPLTDIQIEYKVTFVCLNRSSRERGEKRSV